MTVVPKISKKISLRTFQIASRDEESEAVFVFVFVIVFLNVCSCDLNVIVPDCHHQN